MLWNGFVPKFCSFDMYGLEIFHSVQRSLFFNLLSFLAEIFLQYLLWTTFFLFSFEILQLPRWPALVLKSLAWHPGITWARCRAWKSMQRVLFSFWRNANSPLPARWRFANYFKSTSSILIAFWQHWLRWHLFWVSALQLRPYVGNDYRLCSEAAWAEVPGLLAPVSGFCFVFEAVLR